jgi:Leucine-rich repeat (LRR) protein
MIESDYAKVTKLDYSKQNLVELPDLTMYVNLEILNCNNNKLIKLGKLPDSLLILYCCDNRLTELEDLPPNLRILHCANNNLTYLDNLPSTITFLSCFTPLDI